MENLTPTDAGAKIVHDAKNTAQAILSTASDTAAAMVEAANTSPTNAELKEGLNEIRGEFKGHAAEDKKFQEGAAAFQDAQTDVNAKVVASLDALHESLARVATKKDMESFKTFLENWKIGIGIFKLGWNNIGQLAVFFIAVWIIFKVGVVGAIAYFFGKLP